MILNHRLWRSSGFHVHTLQHLWPKGPEISVPVVPGSLRSPRQLWVLSFEYSAIPRVAAVMRDDRT